MKSILRSQPEPLGKGSKNTSRHFHALMTHQCKAGISTTVEDFNIVGREGNNFARIIRVNFLKVNNPTINRSIGEYTLPHKWDIVLFNTPEHHRHQAHNCPWVPSTRDNIAENNLLAQIW